MQIAWFNIILFLMLATGHAALIVAIDNRIHALPFPTLVLHGIRLVHDLVIVVLPAVFAYMAGFQGPRLLSGGSWIELPLTLLVYLVLCGAVALVLPFVAIYRQLIALRSLQIAGTSTTVDIAEDLGFRPVGRGPYRIFTRFPGNECLKLELTEKHFRLPRLPTAWDGLSILHLSDFHFIGTIDRTYFEEVIRRAAALSADLVVFTGDLLDRAALIDWLPSTLGQLSAPLGCYFVLGNHDWQLKNTDEIRSKLEDLGWRGIAGRSLVVEHRGQPLVLCGSERPWMGTQPDLASVPADAFRICLSHTPDNIIWARRHKIDLMFAGHNHGGQVRLPGFGAVYSPSLYGCHYAAGAFWESPTLLYVSRGISGKQPLRWNCLPEVTRLVLRTAVAESGNQSDALAADYSRSILQTCRST